MERLFVLFKFSGETQKSGIAHLQLCDDVSSREGEEGGLNSSHPRWQYDGMPALFFWSAGHKIGLGHLPTGICPRRGIQ